jgi:hypothetical protein
LQAAGLGKERLQLRWSEILFVFGCDSR